MRHWVKAEPPAEAGEVAVLIDGQTNSLTYEASADKKVGSLNVLWPKYENEPLFAVLVGIVAQAWQVSLGDLCSQEGWTHEQAAICGRWRRL